MNFNQKYIKSISFGICKDGPPGDWLCYRSARLNVIITRQRLCIRCEWVTGHRSGWAGKSLQSNSHRVPQICNLLEQFSPQAKDQTNSGGVRHIGRTICAAFPCDVFSLSELITWDFFWKFTHKNFQGT